MRVRHQGEMPQSACLELPVRPCKHRGQCLTCIGHKQHTFARVSWRLGCACDARDSPLHTHVRVHTIGEDADVAAAVCLRVACEVCEYARGARKCTHRLQRDDVIAVRLHDKLAILAPW